MKHFNFLNATLLCLAILTGHNLNANAASAPKKTPQTTKQTSPSAKQAPTLPPPTSTTLPTGATPAPAATSKPTSAQNTSTLLNTTPPPSGTPPLQKGLIALYSSDAFLESAQTEATDLNIPLPPKIGSSAPITNCRWYGCVTPRVTGEYTFNLQSPGKGVQLNIGGAEIINTLRGTPHASGKAKLEAGKATSFALTCQVDKAIAEPLIITWESATQPRQPIPANCLFSPPLPLSVTQYFTLVKKQQKTSRFDGRELDKLPWPDAMVKFCTSMHNCDYIALTASLNSAVQDMEKIHLNDFRKALNRDFELANCAPATRFLYSVFPIQTDWLIQDSAALSTQTFGNNPSITLFFKNNRDTAYERALIEAALQEAKAGNEVQAIRAELQQLTTAPPRDIRLLKLYEKACLLRRKERLAPLLAKTREIIFAKHQVFGSKSGIYNITETEVSDCKSELARIDLTPETTGANFAKTETLFDAQGGIVRDPNISFDAQKMLFAWRKTNKNIGTTGESAPPTGNYKIYEMELASKQTRQLTTDETYGADIEPCYLPDGNIIFASARIVQHITCGWGDCSNLFLMDKDGRFARRVGFDQTAALFPSVMDDGRVIYLRRDYNDRGQSYAHKLFQMNPDGSKQTEFYGNNSISPTSYQHARCIPGTSKVLATIGGYHRSQGGKLGIVDTNQGRQGFEGVMEFPPLHPMSFKKGTGENNYVTDGEQYSNPHPLSETHCLAAISASNSVNINNDKTKSDRYKIYFLSVNGRRELLAADANAHCLQPVPVLPRSQPPVIPNSTDWKNPKGIFYVQDVYVGPGLQGVPRGTIKKLRVVEIRYKATTIGSAKGSGPGGGVDSPTPPSIGLGTFDIKAILGDVTVHEDGSALFTVPARMPVYFQMLDKDNQVVQTMRSWATLMPGENFSCVGCHEPKNAMPAAPKSATLAMKRPPEEPAPFYGPFRGFSYPKEIQPIFDAKCVNCHSPGGKAAKLPLTNDPVEDSHARRFWMTSFVKLTQAGDIQKGKKGLLLQGGRGKPNDIVNWITRYEDIEMKPPYRAGAVKSKLVDVLRKGHQNVKMTQEELDKISAWIDLNIPYCGAYDEAAAWDGGAKKFYNDRMELRRKNEEIDKRNIEAMLQALPSSPIKAELQLSRKSQY